MSDDTSDHDGDTARPGDDGHDARRCRTSGMGRRARLGIAAAGLLGIGAVLGGLAAVSGAVGAHGFGGHGPGHRHSLESMTERALDKTAWMLGRVDATPDQEQQMNALVSTLVAEIEPLHREHREHRRAFLAELMRPAVDRAALETIRQEEIRLADAASSRIVDAVAEASRILTPEQRDELLERLARKARRH